MKPAENNHEIRSFPSDTCCGRRFLCVRTRRCCRVRRCTGCRYHSGGRGFGSGTPSPLPTAPASSWPPPLPAASSSSAPLLSAAAPPLSQLPVVALVRCAHPPKILPIPQPEWVFLGCLQYPLKVLLYIPEKTRLHFPTVVRTETEAVLGRMYLWSSTVARTAPNSRTQQVANLSARVSSRMVGSACASAVRRWERES